MTLEVPNAFKFLFVQKKILDRAKMEFVKFDRHQTTLVGDCVSVPSDYFGKDFKRTLVNLGFTDGRIYGRIVEVLDTRRFSIRWDLDQQITYDHMLGTVRIEPRSTPLQSTEVTTNTDDQPAIISLPTTLPDPSLASTDDGPSSSTLAMTTHALIERDMAEPTFPVCPWS